MDAGVTVRFLPAYWPDLNPIELMWARRKLFCAKQKPELTMHSSKLSVKRSYESFKKDATPYFAHCGYSSI